MAERRQMKQDRIVRFGDFVFKHRDTLPVPFIVLAVLVLIFTKPTFSTLNAGLSLFITGGIVILIGESIRIWAVGYSGGTTRSKKLIADRLVTEGPYSIVRNPLYAGNFLIALGFSILTNAAIIIPLVILYFAIEYYPIVRREEYFLLEKFGDTYSLYLRDVPRFFPKKFETKKAVYNPSALKGEMWTMLGIIMMLIFMIVIDIVRIKFLIPLK
jgi:protein-S-isoprenylcysteine O-methyltransferase Ste14